MKKLPYNGPVPQLGFGTYPLQGLEARRVVEMALDVGYRHIDTAQWYRNEDAIGEALRSSRVPRGELFIVTKIHPGHLGGEHFRSSLVESLSKLKVAWVDLLLIHWPPRDPSDFEPTLERLMAAQDEGLARLIGVSNYAAGQFRRAQTLLGARLTCNQVEFHPYLDQRRLLQVARETGVPLAAYSAVARGKVLADPVIVKIADRVSQTPAAVVLRWILQQGVIAVCQTSKRTNAESNIAALTFELSDSDMAAITELKKHQLRIVDLPDIAPNWDLD
jgi:2,5-diketo-D-gluconate reductase B